MRIWRDQEAKNELTNILRRQGYATYARILQLFDFYYTDDEDTVAYMIPQQAAIVMNEKVNTEEMASVLIRHEILHEYLTHYERQIEFEKNHPGLKLPQGSHKLANIAADFDISNTGYTDADKITVRSMMLGDRLLSGLVTEDHNADWVNLTFEEMYEKLLEMQEKEQEEIKQFLKQMGDMDSEGLERIKDAIEQTIEEMEEMEEQQGQGSGQGQGQEGENQEGQGQGQGQGQEGQEGNQEGQEGQEGQGQDQAAQNSSQSNASSNQSARGSQAQQGYHKRPESSSSGSNSNSLQKEKDTLQKASQQVDQLKGQLDKLNKESGKFDNKKESQIRQDISARARQIADILGDTLTGSNLTREVSRNIEREKISQTEKAQQRLASSGLQKFKVSLTRFIKNEVDEKTERSYRKLNLLRLRQDIYSPEDVVLESPVPLINVYHDVSGSFSDPAKTEAALRAIDSLRQYVKRGLLKIKIYYVTESVYPSNQRPHSGGGASGQAIIEHVQATKPANVIVITDSDADDCTSSVTVPGAVWLLFYDRTAPSLITNLRGRKESRHYMIDYK